MSKTAIGIAVLALAALLSGAALGRGGGGHGGGHGGGGHGGGGHGGGHFGGGHFGGGGHGHFGGGGHGFGHAHFGGGHHGGGRFAVSHSFSHGGFHGNRSFAGHGRANFSQIRNAAVARNAMNSLSHAGGLRNGRLLSNPAARAQVAAGLAMAGWHHGSGVNGWWQHGGGGFGWVGPLFWPFAYFDIYDYAIWGDGFGFWGYGYPDIYAGIFAPYDYDDLVGYLAPRPSGGRHARVAPLAEMCGDDSRDIAGLPIVQIETAIQPTEAQGAALDELGNASIAAAQSIRTACPTQIILTAPGRLAAMQRRIEVMISAVATVQPALEKFYGLLNDEQKARLNALADDQRKTAAASHAGAPLVPSCGAAQPSGVEWPAGEIEARLHPNDTQRASLAALQDAGAKAAEMLKAACRTDDAMTPPARLTAIGMRLDTMLQAVKSVRTALENFYATLSDEQKAQFEAIGPRRSA
jgi:LTXXQ motif family protein